MNTDSALVAKYKIESEHRRLDTIFNQRLNPIITRDDIRMAMGQRDVSMPYILSKLDSTLNDEQSVLSLIAPKVAIKDIYTNMPKVKNIYSASLIIVTGQDSILMCKYLIYNIVNNMFRFGESILVNLDIVGQDWSSDMIKGKCIGISEIDNSSSFVEDIDLWKIQMYLWIKAQDGIKLQPNGRRNFNDIISYRCRQAFMPTIISTNKYNIKDINQLPSELGFDSAADKFITIRMLE